MVENVDPDGEAVPTGDELPPPNPEGVPNQQPPPPQPNKSWDTFIAEQGLEKSSLAFQLCQATTHTTWSDVAAPFSRFLTQVKADNSTPETLLWSYRDSLSIHYFLAVNDGKWQVVYGYKRCTPLHGNGGRLAGLRGDRRMIMGSMVQPHLFHKSQGMNTQSELFQGSEILVSTVPDILASLNADPTLQLVDSPEVGLAVTGWPMLPIHPKLACLFMSGPSLVQGFKLGLDILEFIPAEYVEEKRLFGEHLSVGVTRAAEQHEAPIIDFAWTRVDVFADQVLTDWYFSLLASVMGSLVPPNPVGLPIATGAGIDLTPPVAPPQVGLPIATGGGTPAVRVPIATAAGTTKPVPAFGSGGEVPPLAPGTNLGDGGTPLAPGNNLGNGPVAPANGGGGTVFFHRADVGNATIKLLQAMTEKLTTGGNTSCSTVRNYDWAELEYLFERTGAPKINGSFTGLGVESLPDFLQALVTVRGDKANIRLFVERYRANHYPREVMEHDFVWTTQLLKDIRNLSFAGEDGAVTYDSRFRGLSVFSLAPISESNLSAGTTMRQKMMQYEDTESNHGPSEASDLAKMAATWNTIPGARHEALSWVEHIWVMTKMILGDECPANQYLGRLRHNLQRPQLFHAWSAREWKAFVWVLHIAYRAFMADKTTVPLSFLTLELEARKRPDTRVIPVELQRAAESASGEQPARKRAAEGGAAEHQQPRRSGPTDLAAQLSSLLALYKNRTTQELKIKTLFPTDGDAMRIIGPEYLGLVTPVGKTPCWRHHVYGSCPNPSCFHAHNLKQKPSKACLEGIVKRMQERLDIIAQQYPK